MIYLELIKDSLEKITKTPDISVSFSKSLDHGDYTTNIALQISKTEQKSPHVVAEELREKLLLDKLLMSVFEKIEIAGPGFINFFLSQKVLLDLLKQSVLDIKSGLKIADMSNKKIIVEYSSPNIAKPFTVGHLRSTIIGDAVANLLQATGATVYRDNHLGDWGTQFGKQIYAIKEWGDEDVIAKSENPVKELVSLYVKFHEEAEKKPELEDHARAWFKKLEDGDSEARALWQKCIDWSWQEFSKIYEVLGIRFTENGGLGYGESFFEDKMADIITELREKRLLKKGEDNAELVFFENEKYPPLMILKKDGTTLYATRDLATDKWRLKEYGQDIVVLNEVGAEQSLQFNQLYETEYLLGWYKPGQRIHLKHGLFRFADKKMSTRKGNVIWLEDVLHEAFDRAKELGSNEETAKIIGVGALKWNELKRDPLGDVVFDWDEILSMKGNSGPYMQYTVVRIKSLLSKAENRDYSALSSLDDAENEVVRFALRFPEIVLQAANQYRPSILCEYLYQLAQKYNTLYDSQKIIGGVRELSRLSISMSVSQVLAQGLEILGINIPEKM